MTPAVASGAITLVGKAEDEAYYNRDRGLAARPRTRAPPRRKPAHRVYAAARRGCGAGDGAALPRGADKIHPRAGAERADGTLSDLFAPNPETQTRFALRLRSRRKTARASASPPIRMRIASA
jgi:hypothetical protein